MVHHCFPSRESERDEESSMRSDLNFLSVCYKLMKPWGTLYLGYSVTSWKCLLQLLSLNDPEQREFPYGELITCLQRFGKAFCSSAVATSRSSLSGSSVSGIGTPLGRTSLQFGLALSKKDEGTKLNIIASEHLYSHLHVLIAWIDYVWFIQNIKKRQQMQHQQTLIFSLFCFRVTLASVINTRI